MSELVTYHPPPPVTQADNDDEVVKLWLGCARSPHTKHAYQKDLQYFLDFVGDRPLQTVTLSHIQQYRDHLDAKGSTPATMNRRMSTLKSLFSFAHRIGYCVFNVAAPIRTLPRRSKLAERCITEDEVDKLIAAAKGKYRTFFATLYEAGLRVSEALALKGSDVIRRPEGGQITVMGKGGKERAIVISYPLYASLSSLITGPDQPVFPSERGGPLSQQRIRQVLSRLCKEVGIRPISPHWLRHSHATHALEHGAPLHVLRDTLGHSSLAVTSRYIHARPNVSSAQYLRGRKETQEDE